MENSTLSVTILGNLTAMSSMRCLMSYLKMNESSQNVLMGKYNFECLILELLNLTPRTEIVMTLKNADARKLLDALEVLRGVSIDVSLEKQSIAHKVQGLLCKQRSTEMSASELIADMDDDELGWAIAHDDPRIGCVEGFALDPRLFNHLRRERPRAIVVADQLIRCR